MDIEGSELNALKGAKEKKDLSKLAVSLYHKERDLFEIPLYLHKELDLQILFGSLYKASEELVLYGLPV